MNFVIIEDEKVIADNLEKLIKQIEPDAKVLAKISTVRDAIKWLSNNNPDLIFLDIHLSDGLSFGIFDQINVKFPIIFTTAYDQFAVKAFKFNSIDYLLKPINKSELKQSINKYKELHKRGESTVNINIQSLLNSLRNENIQYKKRFRIQAGAKLRSVNVEEIAYFYTMDKHVYLCTKSNSNYSLDYTLDEIDNALNPDYFFRINRKFIVNIDSIVNMHPMSKSRLKLELRPGDPEEAIVSFNRSSNFKKWLDR